MICLWWILFKTFFILVRSETSGSAEGAGVVNGAAGNNGANPGVMNGMVLPQLVFLQQVPTPLGVNNAQGAGLPIIFPIVPQQQQAGVLPPQGQIQPNQPVVPLLALLPQPNPVINGAAGGGQIQFIPVVPMNLPQGGAAGAAAGKARAKHSLPEWLNTNGN